MGKIKKSREISIILQNENIFYIYYYIGGARKTKVVKNINHTSLDILKLVIKELDLENVPEDITTLIFNMKNEKWRRVSDHITTKFSNVLRKTIPIRIRDCYEVSNFGRVRKLCKLKYKLLNGGRSIATIGGKRRFGYPAISLKLKNKSEDNKDIFATQVHELVALCFLDKTNKNPDGKDIKGKLIINHKDHNKLNPIYTNLEFCDACYNANY